jgi:hypothetical protein
LDAGGLLLQSFEVLHHLAGFEVLSLVQVELPKEVLVIVHLASEFLYLHITGLIGLILYIVRRVTDEIILVLWKECISVFALFFEG